MISDKQAEILGRLICYDELRNSWDGWLFEGALGKVDGRSLLGLWRSNLISPASYDTMPSVGLIRSPIFYDTSVTKKGISELRKWMDTHPSYHDSHRSWIQNTRKRIEEINLESDIERSCDTCTHKEKTDQEEPCCYCGGALPEWEPAIKSDTLRTDSK